MFVLEAPDWLYGAFPVLPSYGDGNAGSVIMAEYRHLLLAYPLIAF
jgi:hypothetical protein